jgi:site-specific DNA recombinase
MRKPRVEIIGAASDGAPVQMHRVVIYARVSSKQETRQTLSPQAQADLCRNYCRLHGLQDPEVIQERASAKDIAGRPELQRIMAMCRAGQVGHLVVQDLTRLYRDLRGALRLFDEMEELGVRIHGVVTPVDSDTADGRFVRDLNVLLGQRERELLAERIKRGLSQKIVKPAPGQNAAMAYRAQHGLHLTSGAPYGYRWGPGRVGHRKLIVDAKEAAMLADLRARRESGMSWGQIAQAWLREGVRNRSGRPFHRSTLYHLLADEDARNEALRAQEADFAAQPKG